MRMYSKLFLIGFVLLSVNDGYAADRSNARTTASRVSVAATRVMPVSTTVTMSATTNTVSQAKTAADNTPTVLSSSSDDLKIEDVITDIVENSEMVEVAETSTVAGSCRETYRNCMDQFCLLTDAEGNRCSCSDSVLQSKTIIAEIEEIQAEAELLYTEGVEKEQLGAKADLVFASSSEDSKKSKSINFTDWLSNDTDAGYSQDLSADFEVGNNLYAIAAKNCAAELKACDDKADMEQILYSRMITQDCKNYDSFLEAQKKEAENNKKIAEAAVRNARLGMLSETNLYNRGECLLAYKSCISDKGGCGVNFENCLDSELLERRSLVCENVLDQCMAVKNDVLQDWSAESVMILETAEQFADKNKRQTCFAKIELCLEDGCSASSNAACFNDIEVAAGVCPIIEECDEIVPGIKDSVKNNLGFVRAGLCQSDVDKCLQDKCGANFNSPECLGKSSTEIAKLCPKSSLPGCQTETQFDIIVSAALLQMDYQMLQGCVNYFAQELGRTCGTDMSCLPENSIVMAMTELPDTSADMLDLRNQIIENSKNEVDEFFTRFESSMTIAACQDSVKVSGKKTLQQSVFESSKIIAEIQAENRSLRELELKIAEISRTQDVKAAEENCYDTYQVQAKKMDGNYSYITSVVFEPALRNCHVCRVQQVCEVGGMSKNASGLTSAAGMAAAGAAAGTTIMPGWGTAIGTVVGGVGGYFAGRSAGGEEEFCQQMTSCEDVNM